MQILVLYLILGGAIVAIGIRFLTIWLDKRQVRNDFFDSIHRFLEQESDKKH